MRHIESHLWQRLQEGHLDSEETAELMEHLDLCSDCQARYLELTTPRHEELADLLISDDFTAKTMEQIPARSKPLSLPNVVPIAPSLAPSVTKTRFSPARQFQQRLAAYAVAASLTMTLMVGGAFAKVSSLPLLTAEPMTPTTEPGEGPLTLKSTAMGPLLPRDSVVAAAKTPFTIPPLRLLVERSIANDSKK